MSPNYLRRRLQLTCKEMLLNLAFYLELRVSQLIDRRWNFRYNGNPNQHSSWLTVPQKGDPCIQCLKCLHGKVLLPNKLLYKIILKHIWTYDIQLRGTASTSNIEILERFQSKPLRIIVDAPWCVPNNHIRRDLQMTSVKEKICRSSNQYCIKY
jgi:hypothetical protein